MYVLVLLLMNSLPLQEPPLHSQSETLIRELASDDPEIREKATCSLRRLCPAIITPMEEALKGVKDLDLILRVRTIIKEFWMQKSEDLFSRGHLDEALLAMASAEAPGDPAKYRERRIKEAKRALEALVKTGEGELPHTIGPTHKASELRGKYGRWMLPVLIERLHPEVPVNHGEDIELITQWGDDAIPPLLGVLRSQEVRSKDVRFGYAICNGLHALGRGRPEILKAFRELLEDHAYPDELRTVARFVLLDLREKPDR